MKKFFLLAIFPLLLAGCAGSSANVSLQQQMRNPLFAERYWEEMVDRMASLQINKDPAAQQKQTGSLVDAARLDALQKAQAATNQKKQGALGSFLSAKEQVDGQALLLGKTLYLSTDFVSYPGPSLHLYITAAVDPRDHAFPDPNAKDLGLLASPYGAQSYAIDDDMQAAGYRTVVLWDTQIKRLYAFAQLAK